ncbi:LCP family protein [Kitasatospora phosalacinea]|uniref:LCP family protein n=1 Tax=Kitasatospora phosalacinea TaxID=2065 RepID=A0ABW6GE39_9ACTN
MDGGTGGTARGGGIGSGGGAGGAGRREDGGDGEFEVQLGAAFGLTGGGPEPEVTARLVDGGLAAGRRRKRARRRRTVLLAGALTAAVAVGAGVLVVPRDLPGERTSAVELAHSGPDPAPVPLSDGVTVLLVGTDSALDARGGPVPEELLRGDLHSGRAGAAGAVGVTDTLMLVHFPAGGGEVRELSLPRDVLVEDTDGRTVLLGQVYPGAERAALESLAHDGVSGEALRTRAKEAGRLALLKSVERLADVRVDHYAEVSMVGFYRTAQAIGGVPVCLNHAVDDPYSGARLPAGRQELGAAQALAFVRQRHGVGAGSDLERTRRAQAFLAGVVEKLRSGGTLASAGRLDALYRALDGSLVVDQGWDPVDFVRRVPALAAGQGTLRTLPVTWDGAVRYRPVEGAARRVLLGEDPASPAPSASSASSAPSAPSASSVASGAGASDDLAAVGGPASVSQLPQLPERPELPGPVELGGVPCVD